MCGQIKGNIQVLIEFGPSGGQKETSKKKKNPPPCPDLIGDHRDVSERAHSANLEPYQTPGSITIQEGTTVNDVISLMK